MKATSNNKKLAAVQPAKTETTATQETAREAASLCENYTSGYTAWAIAKFDEMGVGRENAVYVIGRDAYDKGVRAFKKLIAEARKDGIPVIAGRDGWYWIADMNDPDDRAAVEHQVYSLLHRAKEIETAAYAIAEACLPGMRP